MSTTRLAVGPFEVGEVRVSGPLARHARVARVRPGEPVELLDLAGAVGVGTLMRWDGDVCVVSVERIVRERGELPAPLVLGLGVLHTQAFDWAVEKATELGVTSVVPVLTTRSQAGNHGARVDRWQRIAAAAVAQCGRSRPPRIRTPQTLGVFVADATGVRLVAEPGGPSLGPLHVGAEGITVLVGPEGGLADEEIVAVRGTGFSPLPLGPRVLRAETAAVAALAVAQALAGWLG